MKRIICLVICFSLILVLCGCSLGSKEAGRFIEISDNSSAGKTEIIFYDSETMVMYLMTSRFSLGGVTVLLNPDGSPMLYEGAD